MTASMLSFPRRRTTRQAWRGLMTTSCLLPTSRPTPSAACSSDSSSRTTVSVRLDTQPHNCRNSLTRVFSRSRGKGLAPHAGDLPALLRAVRCRHAPAPLLRLQGVHRHIHTHSCHALTRPSHVQGNGKSLRAERAKAVFPEGWAADGGMSSARAGMNGGNSTMNGCNVLYDEMIGDLCDSEGSDRLEVSSPRPFFSLNCHTHCLCFACSQFWK